MILVQAVVFVGSAHKLKDETWISAVGSILYFVLFEGFDVYSH
jgi:hypothetical protein